MCIRDRAYTAGVSVVKIVFFRAVRPWCNAVSDICVSVFSSSCNTEDGAVETSAEVNSVGPRPNDPEENNNRIRDFRNFSDNCKKVFS